MLNQLFAKTKTFIIVENSISFQRPLWVITFALVLQLSIGTTSMAQQWGVKAGGALSFMGELPEDPDRDPRMLPGFQVGGTIRFPMSEVLSLEGGILVSSRGSSDVISFSSAVYDYRRTFYYVDVPVTAHFSIPVGSIRIYGEAGPYMSIALGGNIREKETYNGAVSEGTAEIIFRKGEDEYNMNRLDAGLLAGAGVEFGRVRLGISYAHGLANVSANTDVESLKHRVLSLSLGYWFGGK